MDDAALTKLRARLTARLQELRSEGDIAIEPGKTDVQSKVDDDAAPLAEMSQVIASNRNRARAREVGQIEEALQRMREDPEEFGLCEGCDEPIPVRRLELMPWVRLCAACQQAQEDDVPRGGARKHLTDYKG